MDALTLAQRKRALERELRAAGHSRAEAKRLAAEKARTLPQKIARLLPWR